jgi:putative transposase
MIHKAYKLRLYPTIKQQKQLSNHFGSARWVYNYFLQHKNDQYKATGKSASYNQMSKLLTEIKKDPELFWLNNVSRQCVINSVRNLDVAFNNFFQKRTKHPKFKSRRSSQSFRISSFFCKIQNDGVHIPLIGVLKCKPKLPKEHKLYSVVVSKTVTNKYYISINIEQEEFRKKNKSKQPIIGIDFGLKTFITTNDGVKIEHPKPYNKELRRLKRSQRKLSRAQKGSNRRKQTKLELALRHERIRNARDDFLHKLSSRMIDENQAIYLEDLNVKGMQSRFGKQIQDLGWGEFIRQLSYKGIWYGCFVNKIDRFFPSSKTCSKCGWINNMLTLNDREWTCPKCGAKHDRDVNAAINILEYGRADRNLRTGRSGAVRPVDEPSNHYQVSHYTT